MVKRHINKKLGENQNLIIVQSFPANSTLSKGVIKFFQQYFNVYFINLPGFHPDTPPLKKVTNQGHIDYVQKTIEELGLDSYVIAGISYGFMVVQGLNLHKNRCRAIIGLAPLISRDHLKFSSFKRFSLLTILRFFQVTRLAPFLWNKNISRRILYSMLGSKSKSIIETVIKEIDPTSLIDTGYQILRHKRPVNINKEIPHLLFMNPRDSAVYFEKTLLSFFDNVEPNSFRVIVTNLEHYPKEPTYKYFKSAITENELDSLFDFVRYMEERRVSYYYF